MGTVEQYIDFLENNLSFEEEESFAALFASSREFRAGFRSYLSITKSINKTVTNLTPPGSMTENIFSKLGVGVSMSAGAAISPVKEPFFKSRWFAGVTSAIISISAMILLFLIIGDGGGAIRNSSSKMQNRAMSQKIPDIGKSDKNCRQDYGNGSSRAMIVNSSQSAGKSYYSVPAVSSSSVEKEEEESPARDGLAEPASLSANRNNKIILESNDAASSNPLHLSNIASMLPHPNLITYFPVRVGDNSFNNIFQDIQFEIKNSPSWFFRSEKAVPYVQNKFNNIDITLSYDISSRFRAGANFRQETFLVEYNGKDNDGRNAKYYQQPNLSTYSAIIRYRGSAFGNLFIPIAQASFGGNSSGFVTRGLAGIEIKIIDNAFFIIGGEYSKFFYSHDNQFFSASKLGLNYGMGVNF